MDRRMRGLALAAALLAPAPAALAADAGDGKSEKTETERRLEEVLAELEAQRLEINALKAQVAAQAPAAAPAQDGTIQEYLDSEAGRKALDKSLFDGGFVKAGFGSMKITELAQAWFVSQRSVNPPGAAPKTGVDTFRVRRAEVAFSGSVVRDTVDYRVMIDPARANGDDETVAPKKGILQDFMLLYRGPFGLPRDMVFTAGQFKIPFGREGFSTSTAKLDFINRSEGSVAFSDARRPGAMIQGAPFDGALEWWLDAHNTRGQNSSQDDNDEKNRVARIAVNPLKMGSAEEAKARAEKWGDLGIGLSFLKGVETDAHLKTKRYGADAEWRKRKVFGEKDGAFLRTEWSRADNDDALANDKRTRCFAAGYALDDHWELVLRHDQYEDQTGGGTQRVLHTYGLNYCIQGNNAKIDLDWINTRSQAGGARDLFGTWILQFQVAF